VTSIGFHTAIFIVSAPNVRKLPNPRQLQLDTLLYRVAF
jgi:hypothetical protein